MTTHAVEQVASARACPVVCYDNGSAWLGENPLKTLLVTTANLLLLSAAPAMAMICCGGSKDKANMRAKGSTAMNTKGKKGSGGCEEMSSNMSKRS